MKVAEIWRYPVKTMAGEKLQRVRIGPLGLEGDRIVHVEDAQGHVITSRCIMTAYDPDTQVRDKGITRDIYRRFAGKLALNCFVIEGGDISLGDAVELMRGRACAESAEAADFAE